MNRTWIIPVAAMAFGLAVHGDVVTRGFDDLLEGFVYSNQYAEFSLSTDSPGFSTIIYDVGPYAISSPYSILSYDGGTNGSVGNLIIDYYSTAVSFGWSGAESTGNIADVWIYESGSHTVTTNLVADGNGYTFHTFDLSGYSNVTRVEIRDVTDTGGIAFDNFAVQEAVPEPASVLLVLIGSGTALTIHRVRRLAMRS